MSNLCFVKLCSFIYAVKKNSLPEVGDSVQVVSLGKKATVLKVEPSKQEILVQVGNMKLKLKSADVKT